MESCCWNGLGQTGSRFGAGQLTAGLFFLRLCGRFLPGGLILLFFLFELGTDQLQDGEPGSVANPPASLDNSRIAADRKSTRLNSSHLVISYAVFCLKKKKISQCTSY